MKINGDPASLPADSKNEATITFTASDGDGNNLGSVSVPVTLWVDPSGYTPPGSQSAPTQNIYLPAVQR